MQKPQFVTFTGLDAWTDLDRVQAISRRWPVEWGVLASRDRSGVEPRYPSLSLYDSFASLNVPLSLHLCGSHARQALTQGDVDGDLKEEATWLFRRIQFNLAEGEQIMQTERGRQSLVKCVKRLKANRGIVQCRGAAFPSQHEVDWLFDQSAGTGKTPGSWPAVVDGGYSVGYAGGLGPDNVEESLNGILATHPADVPYWIDMESRIRTDDRLDLDACEAVLGRVYGS